jgi:hypothetical protein
LTQPTASPDPSAWPALTPARRHALAVLAAVHPHRCRRTSYSTEEAKRRVYWQPADWLVREGLAAEVHHAADPGLTHLALTDAGIVRALAEGMPMDAPRERTDPETERLAFLAANETGLAAELLTAAQDLARGMNDTLSEVLARVDLPALFGLARGHVEEDLDADRPPDLLRAFTEAALEVDPALNDQPPEAPTEAELALAGRVLAEASGPVFSDRDIEDTALGQALLATQPASDPERR